MIWTSRRSALLLLLAQACAAGTPHVQSPRPGDEPPEALAYRLDGLADDDPRRAEMLESLTAQVVAATEDAPSFEPLEQAVTTVVRHLRPAELESGVPPALVGLAERLLVAATARGDAGAALGAICLLRLGNPDDAALRAQEEAIERWVDSARPDVRPEDPSSFGLAYQYATDDARIRATAYCASAASLERAVRVLVDGSRPVLALREMRFRQLQQRVRLSLAATVAAMYVVHGDLAGAVRSLPRDVAPDESDVLEAALVDASRPGPSGADALLSLAESLGRLGREPLEGALRVGRRAHPGDPRFPLSLAHLARERGEPLLALAGYEDAVRLAEGQPVTHEQALQELLQIAELLVDDEDRRAATVVRALERMRRSHARRFPDRVDSLQRARFAWVAAGVALLDADPERAARALAAEPTLDLQLAAADARIELGDDALALGILDRLLADPRTLAADAEVHRARTLRLRGDALRSIGRDSEAVDAYREARFGLRRGAELGPEASIELALATARGGAVDRAVELLGDTLEAAPGAVPAYVVLVQLALTMDVPADALDHAFAHATVHEALHPEVMAVLAAMGMLGRVDASADTNPALSRTLERCARLSGFPAAVARFALERTDADSLMAIADTPGRRSEARFLVALRARRDGGEEAFRSGLREVLALGMFREPSHRVARELLLGRPSLASPAVSSAPTTSP